MNRHILRLEAAIDVTGRAADRLKFSIDEDGILLAQAVADTNVERNRELLRVLDAFVQRFQQVHEHMTHRLYPAIYRIVQSGERPPPFMDLFTWLEGFKLIDSAKAWVERTEIRNRLIHEYPLDAADRVIALQAAIEQSSGMLNDLDRIMAFISARNILGIGHE